VALSDRADAQDYAGMSAKGKFFDIRDTRPEKARPWLQQETGHDRDAGEAITSIFDAVEIGTEADVMRVLGACTAAQRESRNELGQVPIEAACWHGRAPALRLLATRGGASLYSQWTADSAPLEDESRLAFSRAPLVALAAARGHVPCLQALRELVPQSLSHSRDARDWLAAHYAAAAGADGSLRALSELGAGDSLRARDRRGRAPAHAAAERNRGAALRALAAAGADVGAADAAGRTPLHDAAALGQTEAVEALLGLLPAEAVDVYDHEGLRAVHLAARHNRSAVMAALLRGGADLAVRDKDGRSAAHWAAAEGHDGLLRQLAAAGAPLAHPDGAGHSPAYLAAEGQHKHCLTALAEHGPKHLGAAAGFAAQAVRQRGYQPDQLPGFDASIFARNLTRVKERPK